MRGIARLLIGLVALAFGGGAAAQESPAGGAEGIYVTEMMEMASMLDLGPDGRFRWMLSYGALDMSAEGRWREEGGAVMLDTEPPVIPPRFEFLGSGREGAGPLAVRIEEENGRTPQYLDVEASYESGAPGHASLDEEGEGYRFEPTPGRRIVSIRVGSGAFRFWSEPYPVPADANRMRFRFFPGDLGRADFRGTRATLDGQALLLPVLGEPLRYRRLTAAESAELRTALTEIQAAIAAEMSADADAAVADPSPPLSAEETANDLACMNEGLRLPRSEAIAACTALLASTNLVPEALAIVRTNRGNHLTDDGQYDLAIADYEEALRLNLEYGMAYRGRAAVHEGRGDFARAAADSREAARREPGDATVLNSLCWHLALAGESLDEARNACDASLALRPDDPATLDSRGLVGLKQERFAEAHADFDAAVRHGEGDEDLASFVYGRGIAALRLGRTAEGQADLARAAALDATIAETYARHGVRP